MEVQTEDHKFIAHWRLIWFPGFSLFIGKHNDNPSIWVKTRNHVLHLDRCKGV